MTTAASRPVWVHKGWPVEKLDQRAAEHLDKAFRGDRTLSRDGEVIVWLWRQLAEMRHTLATHVVLHPTNDAERLQDLYQAAVRDGHSGLSMIAALDAFAKVESDGR